MDIVRITSDLADEHASLEAVIDGLSDEDWSLPTRCDGWTVGDQVAHLAYFDATATQAVNDPDRFMAHVGEVAAVFAEGPEAMDDITLGHYRSMTKSDVIAEWRRGSARLIEAASGLGDRDRVPWYGPPMGARSFLSARLMETWVHGEDVVVAVGAHRAASDRLRHVAQLGVNTRGWSYQQRGMVVPEDPILVTLSAPSGAAWTFGPDDAAEAVSGSALDFCEVVTQRRHLDDTQLRTTDGGREWLLIAQAFAGPPTVGPSAADS